MSELPAHCQQSGACTLPCMFCFAIAHADLGSTKDLDTTHMQQMCSISISLHCRIIAGPGSGKTRVLTSRVEYLIKEKGCKPWEMVVITFSNKAARELQDRLAVLLGQKLASQVIAGLPHSLYTHMQLWPLHPHLLHLLTVTWAQYLHERGTLLVQLLQAVWAIFPVLHMQAVHAHPAQADLVHFAISIPMKAACTYNLR